MAHFDIYTLRITPLSPIHIGTGESYEPTNYVIDGSTLYEFDTGAAMAALTPQDRANLLRIVNQPPSSEMVKQVQRFFADRRGQLIPHAIRRVPVLDGVASLYAQRVGKAANVESHGNEVINRLEIDRTAYDPITRHPILPGSSIKGAIRTALLSAANNDEPPRPGETKGLHEFQGRIFDYYHPPRFKLQRDPMRLIHVADAVWQPPKEDDNPGTTVFLAVNRKKHSVRDERGNVRTSQAESQNLYQILECTEYLRRGSFQTTMSIYKTDDIISDDIPSNDFLYKIKSIAEKCNKFYYTKFISELEFMAIREQKLINDEWLEKISNAIQKIQEKFQKNTAFLLRIGRHSGAECVTLDGVRRIKIMRGKGTPPEYLGSPKTLWLAANEPKQPSGLIPFGWALIELFPFKVPGSDI